MAKRFCDTEIYKKDWFVCLPPEHKLLWDYVTKDCDSAGIWDVNLTVAQRLLGLNNELNLKEFIDNCNKGKERVLIVNKTKIFITTTIHFQYGKKGSCALNTVIPAIKGVIDTLNSYESTHKWLEEQLSKGYITLKQPLDKGNTTLKDKDKDKDKDIKNSSSIKVSSNTREEKENLNQKIPENAKDLFAEITDYFSVNEIESFNKFRFIANAITLLETNGRLDYFKTQFKYYKKYKDKSEEKTHALETFFGDPREGFDDGGWDKKNWKAEYLKQYGQEVNPKRIPVSDDPYSKMQRRIIA